MPKETCKCNSKGTLLLFISYRVSPVFQWVQNNTHLFIQIKFAHRHDAPGCLEVKSDRIEFSPNGFYFSAYGIQAQQPIHFLLNLTFYKDIISEQSTWNLESVGKRK